MKKTLLATAIVLMATMPATAAYVSDGVDYDASCNSDGYVLTSKTPVTGRDGTAATEKIYLGKSCDAYHADLGDGKWCWANGGFRAEFAGRLVGFPRQELSCPGDDAYSGACGCQ